MADDPRPPCKYGDLCYQRNKAHLEQFWHAPKADDVSAAGTKRRLVGQGDEDRPSVKRQRRAAPDTTTTAPPSLRPRRAAAKKPVYTEPDDDEDDEEEEEQPRPRNRAAAGRKATTTTTTTTTTTPKDAPSPAPSVPNLRAMPLAVPRSPTSASIGQSSGDIDTSVPLRVASIARYFYTDRAHQKALSDEVLRAVVDLEYQPPSADECAAVQQRMQNMLHLQVPSDFVHVLALAKALLPANPCEAFVPLCGVRLVGAFHVALLPDDECAKLLECPPSPSLHQHYRYFFDPPEMTTLGVSTNSGAHWAYWRDEPDQVPPIVVHSCDPAVCELYTDHASFLSVLKERVIAPKPAANKATKQLLQAAIHAAKCETAKTAVSARANDVVATPFNLIGMVVPVTRDDVGYRPLGVTNAELMRILRTVAETGQRKQLTEIITRVQWANDESDPGMGLELGIDVFCFGHSSLTSTAARLLRSAYLFLHRELFATIVVEHLNLRFNASAKHNDNDNDGDGGGVAGGRE